MTNKFHPIYFPRMIAGFIAYLLGLLGLNYFASGTSWTNYFLLLLPIVPLFYVGVTIIQYVIDLDEMLRKSVMEGMAFAGLMTAFTCFSFLFVHDLSGINFKGPWAFYIYWFYYALGIYISSRRFS